MYFEEERVMEWVGKERKAAQPRVRMREAGQDRACYQKDY